ncbi:unnamed protein product [Ilex paraguariensis]|uniref:Uncharacterized protein n=1 Tax=Ilex paraguariensis TaxID=185542 RepID=A0ABC8UH10_9AQUA
MLRQQATDMICSLLRSGFSLSSGHRARAALWCQITALLTPTHRQDLTARRARRMRFQPRVNASYMESVSALRQHSDFVSSNKFRQANRAIGKFSSVIVTGGVGELGQRFEDLFLEAFVRRRRLGRGAPGSAGDPAYPGTASDGNEAEYAD